MKKGKEKYRESCVIVPIKTTNKRFPGKTFKSLDGNPLYTHLFNTLKKSKDSFLDQVYIDSSDEKVLSLAEKWGFQPIKRPEEYNGDDIAGDQLISRIIDKINYSIIGWVHITSPFLKPETLKKSIDLLKENPKTDSIFGVVPVYNRIWYQDRPLNHDLNNLIRTQDLKPVYSEADFYFFRKESFVKYGHRICGDYKTIEVEKAEATDIDTLEDLVYAESLIKAGIIKK